MHQNIVQILSRCTYPVKDTFNLNAPREEKLSAVLGICTISSAQGLTKFFQESIKEFNICFAPYMLWKKKRIPLLFYASVCQI